MRQRIATILDFWSRSLFHRCPAAAQPLPDRGSLSTTSTVATTDTGGRRSCLPETEPKYLDRLPSLNVTEETRTRDWRSILKLAVFIPVDLPIQHIRLLHAVDL